MNIDEVLKEVEEIYDSYCAKSLYEKVVLDAEVCKRTQDNQNIVYIIRNKDSGLFKIGSTYRFLKRNKEIAYIYKAYNGKTEIIEPMLEIYTGGIEPRIVEFNLHRLFEENRRYGEWFELNESDFDKIIYNFTTGTKMIDGVCVGELYFPSLDEKAMKQVKSNYSNYATHEKMWILLYSYIEIFAKKHDLKPIEETFGEKFQMCTTFSAPFMRYFEALYA